MDSIRRGALGAVVLTALVGLTLSAPASVAACLCGGVSEGDVVFAGRVVDSPNDAILLHDLLLIPSPCVYTFDVESVMRGDALDGRVYSGYGNCNSLFEVGATYLVHTEAVDPGESHAGNPPGVPLLTHMCMAGELLEPPPPLLAISAWARSSQGVLLLGAGLFLVMVGAGYLWHRRTRSSGIPLPGSD